MPDSLAKTKSSEKQAGVSGLAMAGMKIFIKITTKRDSSEAMVKSLQLILCNKLIKLLSLFSNTTLKRPLRRRLIK